MPVADRPEGIFFLRFRQTRPERTRVVSVADGDVRVGHQIPEPDRVFRGPTLRGDQQHLVFVGDVHEGNCPGPPGLPPYRAHETNIISAQSVPQAPAAEFADQNMKSRKQLHDPPRRAGPRSFLLLLPQEPPDRSSRRIRSLSGTTTAASVAPGRWSTLGSRPAPVRGPRLLILEADDCAWR